MELTPKQEKFCLSYIETGNASEAYRLAYKAERMTDKTVNEESCRTLKVPKIAARVKELKGKLETERMWSRQQAIKTLKGIARSEQEAASARIAAVKELNAMHGYNTPVKNQNPFMGPDGEPLSVTINTIYVAPGQSVLPSGETKTGK